MSRLVLVCLVTICLVIVAEAQQQGPSPVQAPAGPFQYQVANDLFKAWLTYLKIMIDILRRNVMNEDGFKQAIRMVINNY